MSDFRCLRQHPWRALVASATLLLAASAWMPTALADPMKMQTPTITPESVTEAPLSVVQLQLQLEELRLRVQGMEGKLKDSATARKSADQARMDAERRLAEGAQESDRLRQALLACETEVARLGADLMAARQAQAELAERLAAVQRRLPAADDGHPTCPDGSR